MEQQVNPLKQYFRQIKVYIPLPSNGSYYADGVIELTTQKEVGILPMTGSDEIALKNPDALLNGEALVEVITSCVPAVKKPRELLANDVDALITAIRLVTFNDSLETQLTCPSCKHENNFKVDLQYAVDNIEFLDPEYVVHLDSGVSVFVKPYSFPDLIMGLHSDFEQVKLARIIDSKTLSDEERTNIFGKAFKTIATNKFQLMCSGIVKIVDESKNVSVTDKAHIKDFLYNIDKKSVDKIHDMIIKLNGIGIKRTFTAVCVKCEHNWESQIDFNPVNFS